jgi:molecular chaperone GrpE
MTEKKHPKHKDEEMTEASAQEAVESPEIEEQAKAEMEALQKRVEEAEAKSVEMEAKSAENLDGWQRAVAEFQNYRKRMERDREADRASMRGDIIKKFLPVLDDLERALKNRPSDSGPWIGGIELIHKKLQSILEAEGLKRIEAEGQMFDPNFHEAISHEPADGVESGHVIAIVQNGYTLGERVIRPALVRVAQ